MRRKRKKDKFLLPFRLQPLPKTCYGKVCYVDKKTVLTAKNKRLREGQSFLREYYCDKCFSWHLTKQKEREDVAEILQNLKEEFENTAYADFEEVNLRKLT